MKLYAAHFIMMATISVVVSSKPVTQIGKNITKHSANEKQETRIYHPSELETSETESCIEQCQRDWKFGYGWEKWVDHCLLHECGVEPDPDAHFYVTF
ncbi:uncharacterized protein LOC130699325 [Daphnia carinata]|uniref:uncharacterized protein LOC130699325 n=1 Tax=Daphnia carinata TaxID=120202 RepID=UPI00257EABB1|nr:uncharacterized protein LOC130699325 [Daphnia carinata]